MRTQRRQHHPGTVPGRDALAPGSAGAVTSRWQLEIAEGNLGVLCSRKHSPQILGDLGTDTAGQGRDLPASPTEMGWMDAQGAQQGQRGWEKTRCLSFQELETKLKKKKKKSTTTSQATSLLPSPQAQPLKPQDHLDVIF